MSPLFNNRLELLFLVIDRKKTSYYADLLLSFDINFEFKVFANGNPGAEIRDLLGLSNSEKTLIVAVIREDKVRDALDTLNEKFATIKNGKGIAWTVSLSSVIGVSVYGFLANNRKTVKGDMKNE